MFPELLKSNGGFVLGRAADEKGARLLWNLDGSSPGAPAHTPLRSGSFPTLRRHCGFVAHIFFTNPPGSGFCSDLPSSLHGPVVPPRVEEPSRTGPEELPTAMTKLRAPSRSLSLFQAPRSAGSDRGTGSSRGDPPPEPRTLRGRPGGAAAACAPLPAPSLGFLAQEAKRRATPEGRGFGAP